MIRFLYAVEHYQGGQWHREEFTGFPDASKKARTMANQTGVQAWLNVFKVTNRRKIEDHKNFAYQPDKDHQDYETAKSVKIFVGPTDEHGPTDGANRAEKQLTD